MAYHREQRLNEWVDMLDAIYGGTQNYSKSLYQVHSHLTEVCGVYVKHYFKRHDHKTAATFLPKMFAWATALVVKIGPQNHDVEQLILRKFPGACPYCGERPCTCWKGQKPTLDGDAVRQLYYKNAASLGRSPNDFQLMFREIYGDSWVGAQGADPAAKIVLRLMEELAEVGEALRFHHLYPDNFANEVADFFAWWFALVSCTLNDSGGTLLAEESLWQAYPGICLNCQMLPCFCRPGPVRELMSRPAPGQGHRLDSLTATNNQGAYLEDVAAIGNGKQAVVLPLVCARVDVDDFKAVNTKYGHPAGDTALRHIASALQQKVRERDRIYRVGGDEFAVLFNDYSEEEAAGTLKRAIATLQRSPVRWVSAKGDTVEFNVSVSVGVAECHEAASVEAAFERADAAAYQSKERGKSCVTRAADMRAKTAG